VGTDQSQLVYTVSLTVRKSQETLSLVNEPGTGYLDDWLIVSFGISDESSNYIMVTVDDILKDHDMCKD
jgi:hypothetical protein